MRRSGSKLCLIAMIQRQQLSLPVLQRAAWNSIPGITYMLQMMTVLIPIFPPRKLTQHE